MASDQSIQEAKELLDIEEADCWFEYHELTHEERGTKYQEIEPWAWAGLQQKLQAINRRRTRLGLAPVN